MLPGPRRRAATGRGGAGTCAMRRPSGPASRRAAYSRQRTALRSTLAVRPPGSGRTTAATAAGGGPPREGHAAPRHRALTVVVTEPRGREVAQRPRDTRLGTVKAPAALLQDREGGRVGCTDLF